MTKKLFLPGASGSARFWKPVAERLPTDWDCHCFSWPGLGVEPHRADVTGIDDLVDLVLARIESPVDLVAQSMGGLVALKVAIEAPGSVRRLVLAGTSGGIAVDSLGGLDWRAEYREEYPGAMSWITQVREDLSLQLSTITAPTLLLWGDRDSISPPRVGERLAESLPNAVLRIIRGGRHDFPMTHPDEVARRIHEHLS
ncbi:alpha/beta fold hydrolase [Sphingosinicella terrae]|uniref:alpha/beta fold hydrolase n=1 Tax=Sphingosinicella terrae TaxID=2172047 RepID=UPI000E0D2864|nr:alpha/beta hydrolase [Sphingosinicella terrae]